MMRRAQTAVEFLTTYGWVLVGLIILLAVLLYYGAFDPLRFVPRQCTFEPGLPCTSHKLEINQTTGTIRVITQLSNDLGYDISLPDGAMLIQVENIGKPGKNTYVGNCSPKAPYIIKKGGSFTCIVEIPDKEVIPQMGKNVRLQADLVYRNCLTDPNYLQTGNCTLASNYTSEGTAVTPVEGFSPTLYCGDGICGSSIGENPTTCPVDCPPPVALLLTASPTIVSPDGNSKSTITAKVLGVSGPLNNVEVVFISTPIGKLSRVSAVTNLSGVATVQLSSNTPGKAAVTAIAYIANTTNVTFQDIPAAILMGAYDRYFGICGSGSYIITQVVDSMNRPVINSELSFSSNATGTSSLSPDRGFTDDGGYAISYLMDNKVESVNVTAKFDLDEYGVHLSNSTVVNAVSCQACNAPVMGDWIIDKKVVCEDAVITLKGDLNISVEISYIKKWGDLTFRNVTLVLDSSYDGERGVFMNRKSRFLISDKDNNPATTGDRSTLTPSSWEHYTFWVKPNAESFEMRNSYMRGCGYITSPHDGGHLYDIIDYRTGLFVSINNTIIENNIIAAISYQPIAIILNRSSNTSIRGNSFDYPFTGLLLTNSNGNVITNNTVNVLLGMSCPPSSGGCDGTYNPTFWLNYSYNNTISGNYLTGDSMITAYSGPCIKLQSSTDNYILNNYIDECDEGVDLSSSDRNVISNNRIKNSRMYGVFMFYADNNTFENNEMNTSEYNTGPSQIVMLSSNNNVFRNNSLQTWWCYPGSTAGEIMFDNSNNNLFSDISIYGCYHKITSFIPWLYHTSRNNTIVWLNVNASGPSASSVTLYLPNAPETKVLNSPKIDNIYLENSGGSSIINNTISPGYDLGIYAYRSSANISLNTIGYYKCSGTGCSWSCHDRSLYSDSSTLLISNNTFKVFGSYAIYINNTYAPSTAVRIENNTFWSIRDSCGPVYGIYTEGANNLVIKNNIISATRTGINFTSSNYPTSITNNTIVSNTYGIHCYSYTTQPTISDNWLAGNTQNCLNCASCSPPTGDTNLCKTITTDSVLGANLTTSGTCITFGADNIVLDCAGHSITRVGGSGNAYGIYAEGRNNIQIRNCIVKNYSTGASAGIKLLSSGSSSITNNTVSLGIYGIFLSSSSNNIVSGNTVYNNTYGITVGGWSNQNRVYNNVVYNASPVGGTYGISIAGGSPPGAQNNIVSNNTVSIYSGSGIHIDLFSPTSTVANNTVYNNSYGISIFSDTTPVSNNTIARNTLDGIFCGSNSQPTLSGNYYSSNSVDCTDTSGTWCQTHCYDAALSTCGTITKNSVLIADLTTSGTCITFGADNIVLDCAGHSIEGPGSGTSNSYGIYAQSKKNITVKNCNVTYFPTAPIKFQNVTNSKIINNVLSDGMQGSLADIYLNLSVNNLIFNNTCYDSGVGGVRLEDSNYTNISQNTFMATSMGAFLLNSHYNQIYNNTYKTVGFAVSEGTMVGVFIQDSVGNNISKNNITGVPDWKFQIGIAVDDCNDTRIEENEIAQLTGYGILITGGDESTNLLISKNEIRDSAYGIRCDACGTPIFSGPNTYISCGIDCHSPLCGTYCADHCHDT
ncbi:MAG: hypothetical protein Sv326_0227 [Candidatus Fermentimicrarchaeum limneticum]|uniref:Big-1 domain-containing protein n=1 Tax=Fermentimicrarchaeum limneticum TaxID=2795018 RepID=A0A7D6BN36_FERL1|nr:MAG: hypothetical protein Sv326_0227 [Candidatus Fermentimicrarchaeum limneticum]